jgi:hypothetical protein
MNRFPPVLQEKRGRGRPRKEKHIDYFDDEIDSNKLRKIDNNIYDYYSNSDEDNFNDNKDDDNAYNSNRSYTPAKRTLNYWTEDEKKIFLEEFEKYGRDWIKIGKAIPNKTEAQIRNYFQNNRNKIGIYP